MEGRLNKLEEAALVSYANVPGGFVCRERLLLALFMTLLLLTHPLGLECLTRFQKCDIQ